MASILVVDDDKPSRDALRAILEPAGHDIMEASDGEAGLGYYHQTPTDLVLVDILMPVKEGLEVIRELKRDFPSVKIIAISGSGVQYLDMALDLGADATITKPFAKQTVLEKVGKVLEESS